MTSKGAQMTLKYVNVLARKGPWKIKCCGMRDAVLCQYEMLPAGVSDGRKTQSRSSNSALGPIGQPAFLNIFIMHNNLKVDRER